MKNKPPTASKTLPIHCLAFFPIFFQKFIGKKSFSNEMGAFSAGL